MNRSSQIVATPARATMTTRWLVRCGVCATIVVMAATGPLSGRAPEATQQPEEQQPEKEPPKTAAPQETENTSPIDDLRRAVDEATKLYRTRDYEQAAQRVVAARRRVAELNEAAQSSQAKRLLVPWSSRLSNLARKLRDKGMKLPAATVLNVDPDAAPGDEAAPVSFVRDVVPVLMSRCRACHVRKRSGELSMASYADITAGGESGPVIIPGNAPESRLVDVLTSGEMPKKGSIKPEQIDVITRWVASGAKFDGEDPAQSIVALLGSKPVLENTSTESTDVLEVKPPTGNETVSFVGDLAPVLADKCGGCHGRDRSSAGLRLDTFASLWSGSQNGAIVTPGDAAASLLIRKLRGEEGAQMPLERDPLADETIAKFATWIVEGAAFDGGDTSATMRQLIEASERANLSHEQLAARRRENAHTAWRLAIPDVEVNEQQHNDLLVLGDRPVEDLEVVAQLAADELAESRQKLLLPTEGPAFHGRLVLFALARRFDYGEFGLMVESRDIPFARRAHWRVQGLDAYVCFTLPAAIDPEDQDLQTRLCEQVTGALLADMKGLPEWFVAGSAREVAARLHPKSSLVATWRTELQQHLAQLSQPTDLVENKLSADATAALGQGLVAFMMSSTTRYTRLIQLVDSEGQTFAAAVKDTYDLSPEELLTTWASNPGRRRR